jgi:hypothetical protein
MKMYKDKEVKNIKDIFFGNVWRKNIFIIYVTEYGTALTFFLTFSSLYIFTIWKCIAYNRFSRDEYISTRSWYWNINFLRNRIIICHRLSFCRFNCIHCMDYPSKYHTVWKVPKLNIKIVETGKIVPLIHIYMIPHLPSLAQSLQYELVWLS